MGREKERKGRKRLKCYLKDFDQLSGWNCVFDNRHFVSLDDGKRQLQIPSSSNSQKRACSWML